MTEAQVENKNPENAREKLAGKKESKREYDQNRYLSDLEAKRKQHREYYHANKERILANMKKARAEKYGDNPRGRPKKYEIDG